MKEWYQGLYSAASDEPKIDFDGYESRFNYRDIMAKGSNKKQGELKEKGLLYFFGCRLPLGLIFSNIAPTCPFSTASGLSIVNVLFVAICLF